MEKKQERDEEVESVHTPRDVAILLRHKVLVEEPKSDNARAVGGDKREPGDDARRELNGKLFLARPLRHLRVVRVEKQREPDPNPHQHVEHWAREASSHGHVGQALFGHGHVGGVVPDGVAPCQNRQTQHRLRDPEQRPKKGQSSHELAGDRVDPRGGDGEPDQSQRRPHPQRRRLLVRAHKVQTKRQAARPEQAKQQQRALQATPTASASVVVAVAVVIVAVFLLLTPLFFFAERAFVFILKLLLELLVATSITLVAVVATGAFDGTDQCASNRAWRRHRAQQLWTAGDACGVCGLLRAQVWVVAHSACQEHEVLHPLLRQRRAQ
mmetsp:Transcript_13958/g.28606  ORF Transcript_13958/g.28606 Transcript_13958/m.28606 type:complete len:326 (+) Transcript_13958:187-1164(+)